jgi:hypothetical protein
MAKKHRCMRCGNTKKVKDMYNCTTCDEIMCKKCYKEETNREGNCYDCNKLQKVKEMKKHVKELMKCIQYLKSGCEN